MNDYNFGNLLYELRTEKGLSQSELGEIFGVSNKAVSKWEMGISKPRPATLIDIAAFFKISLEELLAEKRNEKQIDPPPDNCTPEIALRVEEFEQSKLKKNWTLFAFILITAVLICLVYVFGRYFVPLYLGFILTAITLSIDLLCCFFSLCSIPRKSVKNAYCTPYFPIEPKKSNNN